MSYTITLTNRIDQGNDTSFKCLLPTPLKINKNNLKIDIHQLLQY